MHLAEVLRVKDWLLELQGKPEEAEHNLRAAIDVAREQQAKFDDVRSAITLARLMAARRANSPPSAMFVVPTLSV